MTLLTGGIRGAGIARRGPDNAPEQFVSATGILTAILQS